MIEFEPIREDPMVLSWTILALAFLFLAMYMRALSDRQYPRVAWSAYIVLGGALLLGVTFRHEFDAAHTVYLRMFLMAAAIAFGTAFYVVSTKYADELASQEAELRDELE